ncbi:MAG: type II secretion system protein J [Bryobacteraceae bacterium]
MSRPVRRRDQAGITLLEVLVAVTLLSILSTGVLVSMGSGLSAMSRTRERLMENRRIVGAQRILDSQIQGFIPAIALCSPGDDQPRTKLPFFQGEPQSMRFVSAYSLQEAWRGYPRILEYLVIPKPDGNGVRLVVNELLYAGPLTTGSLCLGRAPDPALGMEMTRFRPIQVGPGSFVLADNLAYCRFSYQEVLPQAPYARWLPAWSQVLWPRAIRIEMAPIEANLAKVSPLTVTAPMRVDRFPIFDYVD